MVELHTPGLVENLVASLVLLLPLLLVITVIVILIKIICSKSSRPNVKKIAGFSLTALFSIIIVFATLYLPKTINDPKQLNSIECGWPMPFIQFESLTTPPEFWTESCISWAGSPMDTEKEFFWMPFLKNVALLLGIIWVGMMLSKVKQGVTNTHAENNDKPD